MTGNKFLLGNTKTFCEKKIIMNFQCTTDTYCMKFINKHENWQIAK